MAKFLNERGELFEADPKDVAAHIQKFAGKHYPHGWNLDLEEEFLNR